MFKNVIPVVVGLGLGAGLSQFPEFAQQYTQRVGGAYFELRDVANGFRADAAASDKTVDQAIAEYYAADSQFFVDRGKSIETILHREDYLKQHYAALTAGGGFNQLIEFAQSRDLALAGDTFGIYKPAVPLTLTGAAHAGIGFLAGYKGLDLLIDAFKKLDSSEYVLIIAGGKSNRVENDKKYLKWYQSLMSKIKETPNIIRVGFVSDQQVYLYFTAADVLVLPYLIMLSASGPMAFSLGHNKPFLASDAFNEVLPSKIIFKRTPEKLSQKLTKFFDNKKAFQDVVEKMREERLWGEVGQKTYKFILK